MQKHAGFLGFEDANRLEGLAPGARQIRRQPDFDGMGARQAGNRLAQPGQGIESMRASEADRQRFAGFDAVESERAQVAPKMAMTHGVPAAASPGQAVGIEITLRAGAVRAAVMQADALPRLRGRTQKPQGDVVGFMHS